MSQENVQGARRFLDQYGKASHDLRSLAADFLGPDADVYPVRKFPQAQPCHGVEEIAHFLTDYGMHGTAATSRLRS